MEKKIIRSANSICLLKLANNKYFVLRTTNVSNTILELRDLYNANRPAWIKKYPLVDIIYIIPTDCPHDLQKYTLQYMDEYGVENVRGGRYSDIEFTYEMKNEILSTMLYAHSQCNQCFKIHDTHECQDIISKDAGSPLNHLFPSSKIQNNIHSATTMRNDDIKLVEFWINKNGTRDHENIDEYYARFKNNTKNDANITFLQFMNVFITCQKYKQLIFTLENKESTIARFETQLWCKDNPPSNNESVDKYYKRYLSADLKYYLRIALVIKNYKNQIKQNGRAKYFDMNIENNIKILEDDPIDESNNEDNSIIDSLIDIPINNPTDNLVTTI